MEKNFKIEKIVAKKFEKFNERLFLNFLNDLSCFSSHFLQELFSNWPILL